MRRFVVLSTCLLLAQAAISQEAPVQNNQGPPSPEQMQKIMDVTFGAMVPFMGKTVEAMLHAMLDTMARPESAQQMAHFTHNYYVALQKEGFTKQEAFEIASKAQLPSVSASGK